jgi:hypothetical protein
MTLLPNDRACAGAILPLPSPAVKRRMLTIAHAMGALIQKPGGADPMLQGCLVLPFAGMVLAGTACARPLLFAECDDLARATSHDVIILRHDALRGTTFDIKLGSESRWFRRYLGKPVEHGVRMAPDIGTGPVLRAAAFGLEVLGDGTAAEVPLRAAHRITSSRLAEA